MHRYFIRNYVFNNVDAEQNQNKQSIYDGKNKSFQATQHAYWVTLTHHCGGHGSRRNGKRKKNDITSATRGSSRRLWWRRWWNRRCFRWKFRRRKIGWRWPASGVAVVLGVPSVFRSDLAEIEFDGLWTFCVDLDGLRDPTVGSSPVDRDGAYRIIQTLTFDLECVNGTLAQTPWFSYWSAKARCIHLTPPSYMHSAHMQIEFV